MHKFKKNIRINFALPGFRLNNATGDRSNSYSQH